MFGFRRRAFDVVTDSSSRTPWLRLQDLVVLFVVSGLALLSWQLLVACRRVDHARSLRIATVVMWLYAVAGILVGASWWRHYLIALIPALAIGTALATKREASRLRTHSAVTLTVAATLVTSMVAMALMVSGYVPRHDEHQVATYLRDAASPGDGVFVAYGSPDIIWESGLRAPYPYSWSLPMRGRDPTSSTWSTR